VSHEEEEEEERRERETERERERALPPPALRSGATWSLVLGVECREPPLDREYVKAPSPRSPGRESDITLR